MLLQNDNCLTWLSITVMSYSYGCMGTALDMKTLCFGSRKGQKVIPEMIPLEFSVSI